MDDKTKTPILNDRAYNALKFVALILLPAIGSAYFALAGIWNLPKANEVNGTILVVDTLLGAILGLSSNQYNKSGIKYDGDFVVEEPKDGRTLYTLALKTDPEKLGEQKEVNLKVVPSE